MRANRLVALSLSVVVVSMMACGGEEIVSTAPPAGGSGGNATGGASGSAGKSGGAGAPTAGSGGTTAGTSSGGTGGGTPAGAAGATAGSAGSAAGASAGASGSGTAGTGGAGAGGTAAGAAGASGAGNAGAAGSSGATAGSAGAAGGEPGGAGGALGGTGGGGGAGQAGSGGSAPACVPTETNEVTCNGLDDDCDGRIDDVDIGKDGFCDCLRIGILGGPGSNGSSSFQKWLTDRGTSVERRQATGTEALDASVLAKFDVMVLDRLARDYTAEEATALTAWVESGGGFMTMTGYTGSPAIDFRTNVLLAPFGLAYQGGLLNGPVTTFLPHPTTGGLTSVTFAGGFEVGLLTPEQPGTRTPLGTISGKNVAVAYERVKGRGVVWGDEWIQFDSEWNKPSDPALAAQIKLLWENVFKWVSPQTKCKLEKD